MPARKISRQIKRYVVVQVPGNLSSTGNWVYGTVVWGSEGFTCLGHTLGRHPQHVVCNLLSSWKKKVVLTKQKNPVQSVYDRH